MKFLLTFDKRSMNNSTNFQLIWRRNKIPTRTGPSGADKPPDQPQKKNTKTYSKHLQMIWNLYGTFMIYQRTTPQNFTSIRASLTTGLSGAWKRNRKNREQKTAWNSQDPNQNLTKWTPNFTKLDKDLDQTMENLFPTYQGQSLSCFPWI